MEIDRHADRVCFWEPVLFIEGPVESVPDVAEGTVCGNQDVAFVGGSIRTADSDFVPSLKHSEDFSCHKSFERDSLDQQRMQV